jgi:UDP-N-acetylglucosamine transferase subunit ALG13
MKNTTTKKIYSIEQINKATTSAEISKNLKHAENYEIAFSKFKELVEAESIAINRDETSSIFVNKDKKTAYIIDHESSTMRHFDRTQQDICLKLVELNNGNALTLDEFNDKITELVKKALE